MASNYSFKNRLADNQSKIGGPRSTLLSKLDPASIDEEPDLQAQRDTAKLTDIPSPQSQAQSSATSPDSPPAPSSTAITNGDQDATPDDQDTKEPDFISVLPPESQQAARFYSAIKPVITQGLSDENKKFFQQQQEKYDQLEQKARDAYDQNKSIDQWGAVGERIAQAVAQLGAGLYGVKHGVDMSGLKFDKTDWAKQYDQNLHELDQNLSQIERGRNRTDRAQEIAQSTAERQGEREGDFLANDYENQGRLANAEANRKAQEAREDTKLAQQKELENQKLALEKQKLGIEQQKADQAAAAKQKPDTSGNTEGDLFPLKEGTKLSDRAQRRFDAARNAVDSIDKMEAALKDNQNTFSMIGDNDFTLAKKNFIRSAEEENSLSGNANKITQQQLQGLVPSPLDNSKTQMKKLEEQRKKMVHTLKLMGADTSAYEDQRNSSPAAQSSKPPRVIQNGHVYQLNPQTGEYE